MGTVKLRIYITDSSGCNGIALNMTLILATVEWLEKCRKP